MAIDSKSCLNFCPQGQYSEETDPLSDWYECQPCHYTCQKCIGPSSSDCISCSSNEFIRDGECVASCGINYYSDPNRRCIQCTDPECVECDRNRCLRCSGSKKVQPDGVTCADYCPIGFQLYLPDENFCQVCPIPSCENCNVDRVTCSRCFATSANNKLNYDYRSCVSSCGDSLYEDPNTGNITGFAPKCSLCLENSNGALPSSPSTSRCQTCGLDGICLVCKSGSFLNLADNSCVSSCPPKTLQLS